MRSFRSRFGRKPIDARHQEGLQWEERHLQAGAVPAGPPAVWVNQRSYTTAPCDSGAVWVSAMCQCAMMVWMCLKYIVDRIRRVVTFRYIGMVVIFSLSIHTLSIEQWFRRIGFFSAALVLLWSLPQSHVDCASVCQISWCMYCVEPPVHFL